MELELCTIFTNSANSLLKKLRVNLNLRLGGLLNDEKVDVEEGSNSQMMDLNFLHSLCFLS